MTARLALAATVALFATACATDTSRLSADQQAAFAAEGIAYQAANLTFRYTHDAGSRDAGWEDRVASIVVTGQSLLIHKNAKVGVEITPRSRRFYEVSRSGDRVRITAGSGKSRETWSFVPPADPDGWTRAIRTVIRNSDSDANR